MARTTLLPLLVCILCIQANANAQIAPTKVIDLNPDGGSQPYAMKVGGAANDRLYFSTIMDHGSRGSNFGIHSTTGTAAGTVTHYVDTKKAEVAQVSDQAIFYKIYTGPRDYEFRMLSPTSSVALNSVVPTLALVTYSAPSPQRVTSTLWNGSLFHPAKLDPLLGYELYRSSPPLPGTSTLIKDVLAGSASGLDHEVGSGVQCVLGNKLYFTANTAAEGNELWCTDGTALGTLRKSNLGINASFFTSEFKLFNNRIILSAADPMGNDELYGVVDSSGMLFKVKEINPSLASGSSPKEFTALGRSLYFTADDGTNGRELWRTDGTAAGTSMVKDLRSGSGSNPHCLVAYNGLLYFFANNGSSKAETLFKTDGTAAGTVACLTLPSGMSAFTAAVCNGKLHYATRSTTASKLWQVNTKFTAATEVRPINSTASNALNNTEFAVMGGALYFRANYDGLGMELWKVQ